MTVPRIEEADPAAYADRTDVLDAIDAGRGWVPNIFRTMLHNPELTEGWVGLANAVRGGTALDDRTRELVILLVAHLYESGYEWRHHVGVAERLGVTPDEIGRIAAWSDDGTDGWGAGDLPTLQLAAATARRTEPPGACIADLVRDRGPRYVVDVAVTAAYYSATALLTTVLDIEPESSPEAREHTS